MKKSLRKLSMALTVVMVRKISKVMLVLLTGTLLMFSFAALLTAAQASKQEEKAVCDTQITGKPIFTDTSNDIEPKPSDIIWDRKNDPFATSIVWNGALTDNFIEQGTKNYRFQGHSPIPFTYLALGWRAYDATTGKSARIILPTEVEVWYRSSLDGISFGDWFHTRGDFIRSKVVLGDWNNELDFQRLCSKENILLDEATPAGEMFTLAPSFSVPFSIDDKIALNEGRIRSAHEYFEILVRTAPSIKIGDVVLLIADHRSPAPKLNSLNLTNGR